MLPGVPREMRGMTDDTIVPLLRERVGADAPVVLSRTLRTTSIGESALAERLGDIARLVDGFSVAYLPGWQGTDLRLTAEAPRADADGALARAAARLRERAGDYVYGEGDDDLAAVVLERCRTGRLTIATAESCTGGMLGERITAIAGSSDVYVGGVVAYDNRIKIEILGVSSDLIERHGAVSEEVARAMAEGARDRVGASVGIAITGIAGPSGGTPEKPVGTVWIGVAREQATTALGRRYIGDRQEIRQRACQAALDLVRRGVARDS
jgi:nicotinamide-nucleotide amidase